MRSPIRYPGGKGLYVKQLLELMPEHDAYGEPFGGGASLLFAKKPVELEMYNDLNHGLVSMFRVLRDPNKFEQFYRMVSLTPYSREDYYFCRDTWFDEEDELYLAWKFYVMSRQGFGANQYKQGWSYLTNPDHSSCVGRWLSSVAMLPELHNRLTQIQIDCLDFRDFFKKFDRPNAVFYVDPPYYGVNGIYRNEFNEHDHEDLIGIAQQLSARIMLSNYSNELYDMLLDYGWVRHDFEVIGMIAASKLSNTKPTKRIESVYMNYRL